MNELSLTKHHGLGNDFLVTFDPVADPADAARRLCDRRRGIGADGLLIGEPGERDTVRMVLHNADGSRAEMSGKRWPGPPKEQPKPRPFTPRRAAGSGRAVKATHTRNRR